MLFFKVISFFPHINFCLNYPNSTCCSDEFKFRLISSRTQIASDSHTTNCYFFSSSSPLRHWKLSTRSPTLICNRFRRSPVSRHSSAILRFVLLYLMLLAPSFEDSSFIECYLLTSCAVYLKYPSFWINKTPDVCTKIDSILLFL